VISKDAPARSLEEKLERARREGRMQTALDLAKQIAKQTPTPENQKVLRDVSLERGEQLLREGKDKEAAVVFGNTLKLGVDADVQARIGIRFAQAGDLAAAVAILDRLPEGPARTKVIGHLVDAALERDQRDRLTPDLHAGFDSVVHAFARYERGQDAEALDTLQAIGLRSPFLEWRVLLRGLSAYSRGDDAKALENWQRLDSERLPWRLVAPFRYRIDAAFRAAQPVETAKRLTAQLDRQGSSLAPTLRNIDHLCHNAKNASQVLDKVEPIAATFVQQHPVLVPRLVRALYAVVIEIGEPTDVERLGRLLPPLADDPEHQLVWALGAARNRFYGEACLAMGAYASLLGDHPKILGDDTPLARAMICERVGDWIVDSGGQPVKIETNKKSLTAEGCFRRSIELVPTRHSAHVKLCDELEDRGENEKLTAALRELVKRFPNETESWTRLGVLADDAKDLVEAERCFAEAMRSDPLNWKLRGNFEAASWKRTWADVTKQSRKKKPDIAAIRSEMEQFVAKAGARRAARLADWAMLEHRLGNIDFARELRQRALALPETRLAAAVAFHLVAAASPKVDRETRAEFAAGLDTAFETPPTFHELMLTMATVEGWIPRIKGTPALVKRLLSMFSKKALGRFTEEQLIDLGKAGLVILPTAPLRRIVMAMRSLWPDSPELALVQYDAQLKDPYGYMPDLLLLEEANELAGSLPRERQQRILEEVKTRRAEVPASTISQSRCSIF
jgi:tetratricopeptide (TPR) repeat protein